ncbi:MAG: HAMP domain-containing protein [Hydrococcus sp. SU_1_0]|nr:HAMP domain-containing protein [Hydrococcus sp. SU_1_0]
MPLLDAVKAVKKIGSGDLDTRLTVDSEDELGELNANINLMTAQIQNSLEEQKEFAEKQKLEKEKLEMAIYTLLEEVSEATNGDLTVRAGLDSMEISTVADLFNAIIGNLQDIAIEAKQSTGLVGSSLKANESEIRMLAEQAIAETKEARETLISVQQMSLSIQAVAANASQAEKITDDTYNTIVSSTANMDSTVTSILQLRTTVGETAKKMKRLGESSQKISQVVSFIEEIALKTNVLAINASVEAGRAGEYGQGFTIVAEQVGALAEQSAAATKEIANIVAAIQAETQEVNQAMESGTTQVVETTRLVESTKQSLSLVLEKSQEVNQLMGSISQSTVSQASTSQTITNLMQKIAELSASTSESSSKVAQSIVETAAVAQKLETTVGQFKVAG